MNTQTKVSVITCTWNSEPYLADSIASVLSQDYPLIEYIFVDGGSSDGTLERIRSIDRPIKLLTGIGGGISKAMNEGIKAATGDVIAHLHSDDYYLHPQVLSNVVSEMERNGRQWLVGGMLKDREGNIVPEERGELKYSYSRLLGGKYSVPHPATFVKRALFEKVGLFDEKLRYAMDWDLWLRIGATGEAPAELMEPLTAFREHPGSLSTRKVFAARREELRVRSRYALHAPFAFLVYLPRFLVRTGRLWRERK